MLEDFTRLFRERLFAEFFTWLEVNKDTIGSKWYTDLYNRGKGAEAECNSLIKIMSYSLWMFNMIANCGVNAGIGLNGVNFQSVAEGIDEASSKRLLALLASSLSLQGLPREIIGKEIPIISSKKFSLQLFAKKEGL